MSATAQPQQQRGSGDKTETGGPPDPFVNPQSYLRSKGWKCLGDPSWPTAGWLDPTKPLKDSYTTEPIMTHVWDYEGTDEKGHPKFQRMLRQVQAQNGQGAPVRLELAFRDHFHPKVQPVDMQTALMIQMERDQAALTAK